MADGGMEPSNGGWTRERMDLVKRTICPKGISDDEFALFIEQCKRSGLDPLLKEAFCVARRQNIGNRERPNWVTKHEFQPSEAGMLARAERFPDYGGIQASAVYADDEIEMDQGRGDVSHRFNPAKRKGALVGAWSKVARTGKLPVLVWLDFSGYVQQTPLWSKIPTTMIEKCARVAALRKAYPEAFGGLYVREEMPAEEFIDEQPAQAPIAKPERRQRSESAALPAKTATREAAEVAAAGMQREPVKAEVLPPEQPAPKKAQPAEVVPFERPAEKPTLTREQPAKVEDVAAQLGGQVVGNGLHGPDVPTEEEMLADSIVQECEHAETEADLRALSANGKRIQDPARKKAVANAIHAALKRLGIVPPPKPAQSAPPREPGQD